MKDTKYILVTGGVISGIGKGVIASSTGLLLKTLGLSVTSIKIDPYLNIDAGTLSPLDHGEVFVLDDGGEVDLDLGNYERFLDITLTRENNITTGKVYRDVIERERRGDYLGKTVQVVPHITDAIQEWVQRVALLAVDDKGTVPDVCVIELGGTIGDIESAPFVEAMRQFQFRVGHENFCLIHVSLVPVVGAVNEQKTKPTQMSVRDLRGLGLSPDIICCRSTLPLSENVKDKISMFCHVSAKNVMAVHDCKSVYHVPLLLVDQGILEILTTRLKITPTYSSPQTSSPLFLKWKDLTDRYDRLNERDSIEIALVGKYTDLKDSYISVVKALHHASLACAVKPVIEWIEASDLEADMKHTAPLQYHESWRRLCKARAILVPGGFGGRGTEGKVLAARWAREHEVPYLGICLGMQLAVVEFARNVCGLKDANSAEFEKDTEHPVIMFMPEISTTHLGGTMRLGSRATHFLNTTASAASTESYKSPKFSSKIQALYGNVDEVHERHRHRYEVNPSYVSSLEAKGLHFIGQDDTHQRMEIVELENHKYFIGVQYHPEYKTRPLKPSAPFLGLVLAAIGGKALEEVVARVNAGETIESCLPPKRA